MVAGQRRRRQRHRSTAARRWTDQDYPDRRSSTTSSRPSTCRITSAARSRTTRTACVGSQAQAGAARAACRRSSTPSAAARAATSRRDPRDTERVLRRQLRRPPDPARSRAPAQQRAINIYPTTRWATRRSTSRSASSGRSRSCSRRSIPKTLYASSQHVWKHDQRRPELGADQPRPDAPRSEDDAGRRAGRSRGTRPASKPTRWSSRSRRRAQDVNMIWAGSDDGWVHVTRDGGKNWEKVTPPDLPEFARISLIEASPHQNGAAYLAANRYQLGDRAPYVYKTDRLRQDLDEDRHRHPGRRFRARDSRGHQAQRPAVSSAPSTASTCRSTTARSGSRCGWTCPTRRCTASSVEERDLVDRHARPRLLRARQHRRAAPGDARADHDRVCTCSSPSNPLRGRDRNVDDRLLPEATTPTR